MAVKRHLKPADDLLASALAETLRNLDLEAEDAAVATLAEHLAAALDDADPEARPKVLKDLAPPLLSCLAHLGASPKARGSLGKGGVSGGAGGRLHSLREARRAN